MNAEAVCVNCGGQFKGTCPSVEEVTSGTGQEKLSIASTWVCEWLYDMSVVVSILLFCQPEVY